MQTKLISRIISSLLIISLPSVSYAHHPNGYKLPDSLTEGLLSGLGHPVIGLDHLAFILGIGILSYFMKQRILIPSVFIISTILGTILHLNSITIPYIAILIASSVLILGLILVTNIHKQSAAVCLAITGLLHGYAYGESIVGAETTPLISYLVGFALIQFIICFAINHLCHYVNASKILPVTSLSRVYGVIALCGGTYLLV